jgi:hypothetical protein
VISVEPCKAWEGVGDDTGSGFFAIGELFLPKKENRDDCFIFPEDSGFLAGVLLGVVVVDLAILCLALIKRVSK